jgi:WD40 repeat protein
MYVESIQHVLTMDALQFIQAFGPIISKAAMQTYLSALPLVSSTSLLLFNKYSAMSRPRMKVSGPRSLHCEILHKSQVIISTIGPTRYHSQFFKKAPPDGRCHIIDIEFPSRIKKSCYSKVAFSPDGQWIAIENKDQRALDIWSVETLSFVKTIANGSGQLDFHSITYSADGKKIMIITRCFSKYPFRRTIYFWDFKTDKRNLETSQFPAVIDLSELPDIAVALSPDGSQIAIAQSFKYSIPLIDVSTGDRRGRPITVDRSHQQYDQLVWSPNGQFLATVDSQGYKRTLNVLSLSDNTEVCLESAVEYILNLAFSPDSSKVVAILRQNIRNRLALSMWCTQTGDCIASTTFQSTLEEVTIAFSLDQDILVCGYDLDQSTIILFRFNAVPKPSLQTYTHCPPKFDPSDTPLTIAYSNDASGVIVDYASQVDADGWILNTKGEREIWTPWTNYDLSCSCEPPQEGQTQYRTLEVMDPETKVVVLRYVIAFERLEDVDQMQEPAVSLE